MPIDSPLGREGPRPVALLLPFVALLPETAALAGLHNAPLRPLAWGTVLLLHTAASIGFAGALFMRMPRHYRSPPVATLVLLFAMALFVPVLGPVALWAAVEIAMRRPAGATADRLVLLRAPEQAQPTGPREGSYGHGAIRPLLGNPEAPAPRRLKALLALEYVPANRASGLLRRVLNDSDEDIRLIAHGILDKREKGVQASIVQAQAQLARAQGAARLAAVRRLAQLQWELIYGGLAIGDVRSHLVASTQALVEDALQLAPTEPGLWFMQGRLWLERGDDHTAKHCLETALRCGLPRGRALPWLAEIAYRARRFDRVRGCLRELADAPVESAVGLSVRYWCGDKP